MTPEDKQFYGEFAPKLEETERIMLAEVQRILDGISTDSETRLAEHIKSRVKSGASLCEKLERKGLPVTAESGLRELSDLIGLRVVTHFVGDIYTVLEKIEQSAVWRVVAVKDYIAHAKPNGYRSLHVILALPFGVGGIEEIRTEIQLRTIAMDGFCRASATNRSLKNCRVAAEGCWRSKISPLTIRASGCSSRHQRSSCLKK